MFATNSNLIKDYRGPEVCRCSNLNSVAEPNVSERTWIDTRVESCTHSRLEWMIVGATA